MGVFPRLPLRLRAEPRLWGAVVLDHPKNPAALRGKGFAMDALLTCPGEIYARVREGSGAAVRFEGRDVWLMWEGTRNARVFGAARRRWLTRSLNAGTLDVVCGDPWGQRDERRTVWFMMVPMGIGLALTLWFGFLLPFVRGPQSQHTPLDWLIACGFCAAMLAVPAACIWMLSRGFHRTCSLYRLTAKKITPLDGTLQGQDLLLAGCTGHDTFAMRLARLRFGDRTIIIDRPHVALAQLLGTEEQQRRQNKQVYRRLKIYGAVGIILYVAAIVLTQPITGVPIWRPLLALAVGIPLYALLGLYGERWLKGVFAAVERRSRQRKNRHASAAGRR